METTWGEVLDERRRATQDFLLVEDEKIEERKEGEAVTPRGRPFRQIPYDSAFRHFLDLEASAISKDVILEMPDGSYLLLKKGESVKIFEVKAHILRLLVNVGEEVLEDQKIARSLSLKGVERAVRSPFSGKIVYITQVPEEPSRYIFVLK